MNENFNILDYGSMWEIVKHPTMEEIAHRTTNFPTEHQEVAMKLTGGLLTNAVQEIPYASLVKGDVCVSVHQNICIGVALDILHHLREWNFLLELNYRRISENILQVIQRRKFTTSIAATGVVAASEDC